MSTTKLAQAILLTAAIYTPAARAQTASPELRTPPLPTAGEPSPQAVEVATRAYTRASALYARGRLTPALAAAREAYAAVPNASTALVVATILAESRQPCEALDMLLLALDLGPTPEESETATSLWLAQGPQCAPGWGWVRIAVEPGDAALSVGGRTVEPIRTIGVSSGIWPLVATQAGYATATQPAIVRAGAGQIFELRLEPLPPSPEPALAILAVEPTRPDDTAMRRPGIEPPDMGMAVADERELRPWAWGLIGTGAALSVGGAVLIGLAVDAAADARSAASPDAAGDDSDRESRYDDAARRAEAFELSGWVLAGAGVAALGTGLAFYFAENEWGDAASLRAAPLAGGAALTFEGKF